MASITEICNRALQKLGAKRINSIDQDTANARSCKACYEVLRDAELRKHVWNFAVKQVELAEDATPPEWGRGARFLLPADYLRLAEDYPEDNSLSRDYQVQGKYIVSNYSSPLYLRYVYRVTDANQMDPLFREALSARMAMEMCEEITQSNVKMATCKDMYKDAINDAKRTNAMENVAVVPPEDEYITVRD